MTELTWRPLPAWPYPEEEARPDTFKAPFLKTLRLLGREIEAIGGREAIVGIVAVGVRADGSGLKADARVAHPGAEVSFDIPEGRGWRRATFHTDAFRAYAARDSFESNVRAIALGLEHLRAVARYGIASTGQQYAGFTQLTAGPSLEDLGRELAERHGGVMEAVRATHPDTGRADATMREYQAALAWRAAVREGGG